MPGFCRDCLADAPQPRGRCAACGSPRVVAHAEIATLTIAHVDCDAFYATIEKRDEPSLRDRPVIVGGGKRGVVAACCYVARTYGVRSAMPMFKAKKLCPDAVVVRPDMEKYVRVGREVRRMMLELTPQVEPLSIDEAFMDLAGTARLHGLEPAKALARFAARVEAAIGITVSIGLSANKFLAKIASDLDKPRGFAVLGGEEGRGFLGSKPVSFIWGGGKTMQARLARDGFHRIADLAPCEARHLLTRDTDRTRFRLIGIAGSELCAAEKADPVDLLDPRASRAAAAEHALDRLRQRFGGAAVVRGIALDRDEET